MPSRHSRVQLVARCQLLNLVQDHPYCFSLSSALRVVFGWKEVVRQICIATRDGTCKQSPRSQAWKLEKHGGSKSGTLEGVVTHQHPLEASHRGRQEQKGTRSELKSFSTCHPHSSVTRWRPGCQTVEQAKALCFPVKSFMTGG